MLQARTVPTNLPMDALLLLLLTLPYFLYFKDPILSLLLPLLALYLFLDWTALEAPLKHYLKVTLIMTIVALTTVAPLMASLAFRLATEGKGDDFITSGSMHDGALQAEEALRLFLEGKNPYAADYSNTLMARYPMDLVSVNPALTHYPYLPFSFLVSVPFYPLFKHLLGWYDQRLVYGLGFLAVLLLVPFQARAAERRLLLWIALGLNPLLTGHLDVGVVTGANDYLVLSLVMLAVALLKRGSRILSAIPLALACGAKATAWFFLPFYLVLLGDGEGVMDSVRSVSKSALMLLGVWALIILPFVFWDPDAFLEDTVNFAAGGDTAYPIRGLGFSALLLETGLLASRSAYFPFWILELSLGGAVLLLFLWRQRKRNTLRRAWLGYALFLGTIAFFSRYLNPNYLGYVLALLALGLWSDPSPISPRTSLPEKGEYAEA